ncbi:MAG: TonB-dependent receptor, partial [Bacteroidota bacterium]
MRKILLLVALLFSFAIGALAQGVTTATLSGTVKDNNGEGVPGASIVATHTPSGTTYGTVSLADGRFTVPAMRVGGPYTVKVSFIGFKEAVYNEIYLSLGTAANLNVALAEETQTLAEVTISADRNDIFSTDRTGAATNIRKEAITTLPTISRSINDFTRLTPQASGRSFIGQDARYNNITIDGSIFNNSFGLADQPGGRTGSTPVSLDAIEEIQVSIAPYDVRQAGFIGAGVNAVTRSGTNEFSGSVFYNFRSQKLVGDEADGVTVNTADFNVKQYGFRLGGPVIKNKLFFFVNAEIERKSEPATAYTANTGSEAVGGTKTRVQVSDLDQLSTFLATNFNYATGPYQGYNNDTESDKFLIKFDYNINQNHKASIRYNFLDSQTDVLSSNSSSLGFGNRRTNTNALNYQNSNYQQLEKIHSIIGEVNSRFGNKFANNLIIGYTYQNEDRGSRGQFFPLVEIQQAASTYITFGFEPFTPANQLSYKTFQLQDNLSMFMGKHILTAGFNIERFSYVNVFFPGSQSVYVYNTLADFYTDANDYLANPNRVTSPVSLRRFQLRYVNPSVVSGSEPVQPTKVLYMGAYIQDEFSPLPNLNVTAGVRVDVPKFEDTGFLNSQVEGQTYLDPEQNPYKINTAKLPDAKALISPRVGFNYDVFGDKKTQVRGGSGLFTGRPVFVWISNQIGNNGVLTGFDQVDNTTTRPFNPNPAAYVPATVTLPATYEIAATDPDFKFPQVWRTNLAVDQRLPAGLIGTLEFIYSKDVNGIGYFNANLAAPNAALDGADTRPRYTPTNPKVNANAVNAIVMNNTDRGFSRSLSVKIEKPFTKGFTALAAYNFGVAKNTIDPGSIASGSWNNNQVYYDPNNPMSAYSNSDQRHRVIASVTYRKEYGKNFASQVGLFWEGRNQGRTSYIYSTDLNGDGQINDLIYVPRDATEMTFQDYDPDGTGPAGIYTAAEQSADWQAYIAQDEYLSEHRGEYTERNGAILPWVYRADFSFVQEFFINVGNGKRNTLQLRADM